MFYRSLQPEDVSLYESLARHPLQSYAWGEFRATTGVKVERLLGFNDHQATSQLQVTFHSLPHLPYTVGYYPKGDSPTIDELQALKQLGQQYQAIFIKLEPDLSTPPVTQESLATAQNLLTTNGCQLGRPLFTPYSFILDLTQSTDQLLAAMKSKTRYNLKVAQKHGVTVVEDSTNAGFADYLKLLRLTTKRQGFYAHTEKYQQNMWRHLSQAGTAKILKAVYQGEVLVAWILFLYKHKLYYPYGASSRAHREVMASNLLMWEAIKFGQQHGATSFDLWGALGPDPDPKDPWFGFHQFKAGYGGAHAHFVGSFDLVLNYPLYQIYRTLERWRWRLLRLKSRLPFFS